MEIDQFIFESKITKSRMAKDLGVSLQHLASVEKRRIKPSSALAEKIQSYTRGLVTVEEIMEGWDQKDKKDPLEEYFKRKKLVA